MSSEKRQWTKFSAYPDWAAAKPRGDSSPADVPSQMASRPPLDCQTNSSAIQVDCLESYRSAVCSHFNLLFVFLLPFCCKRGRDKAYSKAGVVCIYIQNKTKIKTKKAQQATKLFLIKDSSYQEIQSTTTFSGFLMS